MEGKQMSLILFIIVIVLLIGALPTWPYAANWNLGYFPAGGLGGLLILLLVLAVLGVI